MSIHIIIDGYNLIRQSHFLNSIEQFDFQQGRMALISAVARYKKIKHHKITLVFDGTNAGNSSQHIDTVDGIKIKFSKNGETADTVIKNIAFREKEKALIVSSDLDIVKFSESCNATVIGSAEFEKKVKTAFHYDDQGFTDKEENGWIPTTKKRGPKKRFSKKERNARLKTRKL